MQWLLKGTVSWNLMGLFFGIDGWI
jgi:hypothetical protein